MNYQERGQAAGNAPAVNECHVVPAIFGSRAPLRLDQAAPGPGSPSASRPRRS